MSIEKPRNKNSIAKNFSLNLIYQLLTLALPLITTPYVSRVLGAEAIGIYGYTTSIVTYFILLGTLGVSMYGQREIAYLQGNKNKISKTFWEIVLVRSMTLFISGTVFFFIYCSGNDNSLYYKILLIQLFANAFDISWLFQGVEEFDKTVVRNLIVKLLCLVLIFLLVKNESDLWKYFMIYASAEFLGNLSIWLYVPKYINKINIKSLNLKSHIKPMIALFLPQIAIQIYTVLDKTMIGMITNDMVEVGLYEQAQKIVKTTLIIASAFQMVMNSKIANAYARNAKDELKEYFNKSFKFIWFLCVPIMLGIIAIASDFVPIYYGPGYEGVVNLLIIISPIIIIIGLSGITGIQYLIQNKRQKEFTISVVIGCIINIILNATLISFYGATGASISSVIAETCVLSFQLRYFNKEYRFLMFMKSSIKNIIAGIIMFIVVVLIKNLLTISIINLMIEVLVGTIVYVLVLLILKDDMLFNLVKTVLLFIRNKLNILREVKK